MKDLWVTKRILAALLIAALPFTATNTFAKSDFSVKSKAKVEKNKSATDDETDNGDGLTITHIEKEEQTCNLEIKIRNKSKEPATVQLEWYIIAERTPEYNATWDGAPDAEDVVSDGGKKTVSLDAGATVTENASSTAAFVKKDIQYTGGAWEHEDYFRGGDVYKAYAVLITSGGEVLAEDASSSRYLKDEWIQRFKSFKPGQ